MSRSGNGGRAHRLPADRSRLGDHLFPYGISIGRLQAGHWASTVPDRLVAEGRFGVRLGEPVEAARAAFEGCVAAACAAHPWLADHPAQVEWVGGTYASSRLPAGSPLLPTVQQAVTDAGGAPPPERALTAGTDLRLYAAAGIPALHYGPGDLRLAHGVGEQVPVEDLLLSARSLALLALRTCGWPEHVDSPAWGRLAGDSETSRTEWAAAVVEAWARPHRR